MTPCVCLFWSKVHISWCTWKSSSNFLSSNLPLYGWMIKESFVLIQSKCQLTLISLCISAYVSNCSVYGAPEGRFHHYVSTKVTIVPQERCEYEWGDLARNDTKICVVNKSGEPCPVFLMKAKSISSGAKIQIVSEWSRKHVSLW